MVGVDLQEASLSGCYVHGMTAWQLKLDGAFQSDFIITPEGEETITVDSLEIVLWLDFLKKNPGIQQMIESFQSKLVLILHRSRPQDQDQKRSLRAEIRRHGYLPVLYEAKGNASRQTQTTLVMLMRMARLVVTDGKNARVKSRKRQLHSPFPADPVLPVDCQLPKRLVRRLAGQTVEAVIPEQSKFLELESLSLSLSK